MGLAVGGRNEASCPGVQALAVDAGHDAPGGLAQGYPAGEVDAVEHTTLLVPLLHAAVCRSHRGIVA